MCWVLGTGKLISNSCFFPYLLSAERQAHGPLVDQACGIQTSKFFTIKDLNHYRALQSCSIMGHQSNLTKMLVAYKPVLHKR
jgi:hypothetical protein